MEFLPPCSTVSTHRQLSPVSPFLIWRRSTNPARQPFPNSQKLPLRRPFPLFSFPPKKSHIFAHFGRRPTRRQNYLRKKITRQQQQYQQVSQDHNHDFNKVHMYESDFDNSVERSKNLDGVSLEANFGDSDGIRRSETELGKNQFGESIMWNKLESWVEQYKKDSEFWGIGTRPIFIIYQDSEGRVERVVVNEDEIRRRSRVDPQLDNETGEMEDEVNFKISFAKDLAREMEDGSTVIPKNSSVVKFLLSGGELNHMETVNRDASKLGRFSRMSRVGVFALCAAGVIWAIRRFLTTKEDNKKHTRLEKEMLLRKLKARAEKGKMAGGVEVVNDPIEPRSVSFARPPLDKETLVNSIIEAKEAHRKLEIVEESTYQNKEFKEKIEEIKALARRAREIEGGNNSPDYGVEENYEALENFSSHGGSKENKLTILNDHVGKPTDEGSGKKNEVRYSSIPDVEVPNEDENTRPEISNRKLVPGSTDLNEANLYFDHPSRQSGPNENSSRKKLRIITSSKEAREYILRKNHTLEGNQRHKVQEDEQEDTVIALGSAKVVSGNTSMTQELADRCEDHSVITEAAEENVVNLHNLEKSQNPVVCEVSVNNNGAGMSASEISEGKEDDIKTRQNSNCTSGMSSSRVGMADSMSTKVDCEDSILRKVSTPLKKQSSKDNEKKETPVALQVSGTSSVNEEMDSTAELSQSLNTENWTEKNFHEFNHIVEKIGVGFRENYLVAREKASQELDLQTEIKQLQSDCAEDELEWMKDVRLREIVFRVRENELSGRDPFHLMEEEDKSIFFRGLEQKVEKVNEKLLNLHEYFHSNIENLDYGADGISIYDPLEKIIPRWKVSPAEKNPEFLENFLEQRKVLATESLKNSSISMKTGISTIQNSEEPLSHDNLQVVRNLTDTRTEVKKDTLASSKTIIQGSDGSIKKGKRSGKEFWQHTKKWSQGFLESYNAETDPEVKAVMRDIGKDLDKWITEKEIQEAADMMNNLPEKGQKFIRQKLDKVKREMELFGPQAVVSKYREYAEEKEEDYLWWLDLPFVLCIELYTVENEEQRVGLYSLEMAADLELDPKQYHVIAFEDACECKNLCYIIQAQMEVLGNGSAFVVARPPKDAFREAKANGFSVTVIRKGQLRLNIDQTLEEVEESITEIGSKIYHDKIMKERGVDINALMKGVFGINKPAKRKRSKPRLSKP